MVFSSIAFLFAFLPATLVLYYIAPRRFRNTVLFAVSLIFYAWGEPRYISMMILSMMIDYTHALMVEKNRGTPRAARAWVASSVVLNLTLLGAFKYGGFIVQNINALTGWSLPVLNLPLPIGISFYTFQTMSYTIDVYRGTPAQRNIINMGAYVTFFPQLIAGPIVRYGTIAAELEHRRENLDQFREGCRRFVIGLGKKVLLANNVGALFAQLTSLGSDKVGAVGAWMAVAAFAFQIYFDFSGYSDMAIGLGKFFGFNFEENFNYPFESESVTEFWRRWHMSLGTWFREYVYVPLGGSREGALTTFRNLAVVWLLTGLWHGASWNFVLWGAYFGVLIILEKAFVLKWLARTRPVVRRAYTIMVLMVSWVLFAFEDLRVAGRYLAAMAGFAPGGFITSPTIYYLYTHALLFIILGLASTPIPTRIAGECLRHWRIHGNDTISTFVQAAFVSGVLLLSTAYLVDASYNPFLYFRF
jgi:alginate O-acetyltransferase complex protein AlgI